MTDIERLSTGLRVVHVPRKSLVAWCGIAVGAGSRDERDDEFGLAHFVEHTLFKGTVHRRSWHILNRMESVGGELNAYTTKEETMLYSVFPSEHLERAVELLADLVKNSVFPHDELTREKDVVLEELASYRDVPAEAIADDFEDMMLAGSRLGHNILGNETHLRSLQSEHCQRYLTELYAPDNMVFFSVGPMEGERVMRLAQKHFGDLRRDLVRMPRTAPRERQPEQRVVQMGCHQSHTIVGTMVPGMYDSRRHALSLLNNLLGGPGMNSLLNVQLRERRGYVYTVESNLNLFTDCGLLEIYLGCDQSDLRSSRRVIDNITDDLASNHLSPSRLAAAKKQYCGQLVVAADTAEFAAMTTGKTVLYHDAVPSVGDMIDHIQAVTAEDLRQAAELIASPRLSQLTFV